MHDDALSDPFKEGSGALPLYLSLSSRRSMVTFVDGFISHRDLFLEEEKLAPAVVYKSFGVEKANNAPRALRTRYITMSLAERSSLVSRKWYLLPPFA